MYTDPADFKPKDRVRIAHSNAEFTTYMATVLCVSPTGLWVHVDNDQQTIRTFVPWSNVLWVAAED